MTYAVGQQITASDFNGLAGGNPSNTSGTLNYVWSTGYGDHGYGQANVPNVTAGTTVSYSDWANLTGKISNCGSHQGTSLGTITTPASGGLITYQSNVGTNLTSISTSRLNAATQGSSFVGNYILNSTTTWSDRLTVLQSISFANGDATRDFFNAGGQLALTFTHSNSAAGINANIQSLCTAIGTVVISAQSSGTSTIAGVSYTGVTQRGNTAAPNFIDNNKGYYALTTTSTEIFRQLVSGPPGYTSTGIVVNINATGTIGSNGDKGNSINFVIYWDEVPNGLIVGTGSNTIITVRPPETTYISNTWGTITGTGSFSAI